MLAGHGGGLSLRPRPPAPSVCGGCVGCVVGFWIEQAQADEPPVVLDALDDISVQLELGDDGGREVNPGGVQLGKKDRLVAALAQALQQPLLLGVSERHRPDCGPPADWALRAFPVRLLPLDVWRLGADRRWSGKSVMLV
jgi:hypothetical protein